MPAPSLNLLVAMHKLYLEFQDDADIGDDASYAKRLYETVKTGLDSVINYTAIRKRKEILEQIDSIINRARDFTPKEAVDAIFDLDMLSEKAQEIHGERWVSSGRQSRLAENIEALRSLLVIEITAQNDAYRNAYNVHVQHYTAEVKKYEDAIEVDVTPPNRGANLIHLVAERNSLHKHLAALEVPSYIFKAMDHVKGIDPNKPIEDTTLKNYVRMIGESILIHLWPFKIRNLQFKLDKQSPSSIYNDQCYKYFPYCRQPGLTASLYFTDIHLKRFDPAFIKNYEEWRTHAINGKFKDGYKLKAPDTKLAVSEEEVVSAALLTQIHTPTMTNLNEGVLSKNEINFNIIKQLEEAEKKRQDEIKKQEEATKIGQNQFDDPESNNANKNQGEEADINSNAVFKKDNSTDAGACFSPKAPSSSAVFAERDRKRKEEQRIQSGYRHSHNLGTCEVTKSAK